MASVHFPCGVSPQNLTVVNVQSSSPSIVLHAVGVYVWVCGGKGVYDECHVYKPYIVAHCYVSTCWLHVQKKIEMANTCTWLSTLTHCA